MIAQTPRAKTSFAPTEKRSHESENSSKPGKPEGQEVDVSPKEFFVMILDPATGTATFLVEVIDVIHRTLTAKWKQQGRTDVQRRAAWNDYVPKHLLPRLHGYELMMAPYAIAHMKIGLKLYETGYYFGSDERARIYLTNALEPPQDFSDRLAFDAPALAHEAQAVNEIKRTQHFTVVIGNPPYSNRGQLNRIPFILDLLEDYKRDLDEKKINLDDDFIKFVRFAQWQAERAGMAIIGLITNNTYIDGVTHRRMRECLSATFSDIYILDLHGSSIKKESAPDGSKDENVFDITLGVAIGIFLKSLPAAPCQILHADLWGDRDRKYEGLWQGAVARIAWVALKPNAPYFFFVPRQESADGDYENSPSVSEIFSVWQNCLKTDRDDLFFDLDREALLERMRTFLMLTDFVVTSATHP